MVFLAMILLGLRDMVRYRSDTAMLKSYLPFLFVTITLLLWSIWLLFRTAPLLQP